MDPIQVLGQKDVRSDVLSSGSEKAGQMTVDKARIKNTIAGEVLEDAAGVLKNRKRYVRGMSKTAKRHFINRKDCPVRNHFLLPGWTREEAIRNFDSDLWTKHQKGSIDELEQKWFKARVKELMAGHNIDLVDDIDFVKGNDDSHGYTLKNYIEYLSKEI